MRPLGLKTLYELRRGAELFAMPGGREALAFSYSEWAGQSLSTEVCTLAPVVSCCRKRHNLCGPSRQRQRRGNEIDSAAEWHARRRAFTYGVLSVLLRTFQ